MKVRAVLDALRRKLRGLGRTIGGNLEYLLLVGLGFTLAPYELGYNHLIGSYLLATLAIFNVKLWLGRYSPSDVVAVLTFLSTGLWILARHNANLVPYLAMILFGLAAALAFGRLWQRQPATFRDESRIAENYLDTAVRGLVNVACIVLSLAWIPQPRYVTGPFTVLLCFRLAAPLRRWLYPRLLALAGYTPTDGSMRPKPAPAPRGYTPWRAALLAGSLVLAGITATRLVFVPERVDVAVPAPYVLPEDLLQERRESLSRYVATPQGSLDVAALTELGLVHHNLGLFRVADLHEAKRLLDRALFLDPSHAEARAWYGSNQVAFALYETNTLKRVELVSGGLRELNRAVAQAPADPVVRLARLDVYLGVPAFIGTRRLVRREVEELLLLARAHPEAADPILPLIEHRAGDSFALLGDLERARQHWRAAQALLPEESEDYRTIAAQLRGQIDLETRYWTRRLPSERTPS